MEPPHCNNSFLQTLKTCIKGCCFLTPLNVVFFFPCSIVVLLMFLVFNVGFVFIFGFYFHCLVALVLLLCIAAFAPHLACSCALLLSCLVYSCALLLSCLVYSCALLLMCLVFAPCYSTPCCVTFTPCCSLLSHLATCACHLAIVALP